MTLISRTYYKLKSNLLPMLALLLGLVVTLFLGYYEQRMSDTKKDEQLLIELGRIRAQLEQAINYRLSVITGLEAFVQSQQDLDLHLPNQEKLFFDRFNRFTDAMHKQVTGINSMQLAPEAIVRYMSNQSHNTQAMRHDLLVDDSRRNQILHVISTRSLIVAGPMTLIQGGEAIIARKAIYTHPPTFNPDFYIQDGRATPDTECLSQIPRDFWGLATIVINIDELYSAAGLNTLPNNINFALRGLHGLGHDGDIFWGESNIFYQNHLQETISLPGGTWILAAKDTRPILSWSTILVLVIGSLLSFLIAYSIRQTLEKRQVQAINRAKTNFLATMSHELRTPLNAILGFSQLLQHDADLNDNQRDSVDEISRAGHHLLSLVNDVLDLIKVESGHLELSIQNVQVLEIITDCCALLGPAAKNKQIELNFDSLAVCSVRADSTRLKQAFLNLLSNAIKYNKIGGSIDISFNTTNDNFLNISITDTGKGIAEDQISELFKPFNRLDMQNSHIEGTGIGLAIVKSLILSMNGRVGAKSTLNVGSCFWLELPIATPVSDAHSDDISEINAIAPKF